MTTEQQLVHGGPLCLEIEEVASLLRLSRTKVYELIEREGLPTMHFGKLVRVRYATLVAWLDAREAAERGHVAS